MKSMRSLGEHEKCLNRFLCSLTSKIYLDSGIRQIYGVSRRKEKKKKQKKRKKKRKSEHWRKGEKHEERK